jgi:mannose-6-phosphate isomerase-like protein (cupin superfamily)
MNELHSTFLFCMSRAQSVARWGHATKRIISTLIAIGLCLSTCAVPARSQSSSVDTYSREQLLHLAQQLREQSEKTGKGKNDALEQHLDSATVLAIRAASGRAELHPTSADVFFVVDGHATLITGGSIINPQGVGEIRGDAVQGGVHVELKAGDVVHIPPNMPHQLLLVGGEPFIYVLVKVQAR